AKVVLGLAIFVPTVMRIALFDDWFPLNFSPLEFTPARLDGLALGVLGAYLLRMPKIRERMCEARIIHRVALVALGIGAIALSQFRRFADGVIVQRTVGITFLSVLFILIVLYAVLHGSDSRIARMLRISPLRSIGRVSYFLYLFHLPAFFL